VRIWRWVGKDYRCVVGVGYVGSCGGYGETGEERGGWAAGVIGGGATGCHEGGHCAAF